MQLNKKIESLANGVGIALFGALFCVFLVQITARFLLNHPMAWTDEMAVVLYIWVVLWGAACVVRTRDHVMFDLAYNAVSPLAQKVMRLIGHIFLVSLMGYGLTGNWDYVLFMRREHTPVLGISFFWVFLPFAFLLLSLVMRNIYAIWLELKTPHE